MVERILLPDLSKKTSNEGTVLQWHAEEGASLRPGMLLLTIRMGNEAVAFSFRKKARGLVLKEKARAEGEHIQVHDTLAFVGGADEQSWSTEKEDAPLFGTAQYRKRLNVYRNIVGGLLLAVVVLIALSFALNAYTPVAGLVLSLRTVVNQVTPIVLGIVTFIFSMVCAAYLCQIPPEMWRVLSFHKVPGLNN